MLQAIKRTKNLHIIALLILSGEAVFILPFVLARIFRPTVLEVFQLSNWELGACFSVYGMVALFAYILGGPLADRFPPRKLIAISLWTTAAGGWVYAQFPSYFVLKILYGYWGFTTIFLLWAAMIKATRIWGGSTSQGKAFGFLDGGRGLVGALFGSLGVFIFSLFVIESVAENVSSNASEAFRWVIWISSLLVGLIGFLVWFFMHSPSEENEKVVIEKITWHHMVAVLRLRSVWLLMIIILCGYVGYKITDVFSQYAYEVLLFDSVESAQVGTILLFTRPVVGIAIGFIADSSSVTKWLFICFLLSVAGALVFASGIITPSFELLFLLSLVIIATGIYGVRALYFAAMREGHVPVVLTGTAVGIISLVGYTPDIFAGPAMGYLLDASPGIEGHQHVFIMLSIFAGIGAFAAFLFYRYTRKSAEPMS